MRPTDSFILLVTIAATSCTGVIASENENGGSIPGAGSDSAGRGGPLPEIGQGGLPGPALAAGSRLRRLTVDEYNRTIADLLGDKSNIAAQILPNDARSPFDNDYLTQVVSSKLVTGSELLAGDVASRLLADTARRDQVVGCKPKAVMDTDCLRQFVTRFGRLAWRRTLTGEDVDDLMALETLGQQDSDFYSAVDAVIRTVLQDPEFLFRSETGTPVAGAPGIFKLTGPEMATRLSYFLWGSTPDHALLTLAESGGLDDPEKVRDAAARMLTRPAALARISRFHALWMGYEHAPGSSLAGPMMVETAQLMSRVVFAQPWQELLRSTESYVTHDLAVHYGMRPPSGLKAGSNAAAWVPYTGTRRQGLLSHATFLQLGVKNGETHPLLRGKGIREALFCQVVKQPVNVDISKPATITNSPCKLDKARAHAQGGCQGCHAMLDGVGFGLENYDTEGKYRGYDQDPMTGKGLTQCPISGDGDLDGKKFNGPAELADLMLDSPLLNGCVTKQLYRFAMGRGEIDDVDQKFLDVMATNIGAEDFRFDRLLLDFVSSGAFAHRRASN